MNPLVELVNPLVELVNPPVELVETFAPCAMDLDKLDHRDTPDHRGELDR